MPRSSARGRALHAARASAATWRGRARPARRSAPPCASWPARSGPSADVEIGTGCGSSGIWLLRGMRPDSTLTSVDMEPEYQRLARKAFAQAAGFARGRIRLILGRALDVLPRLSDGGYDMVFCDGAMQEYADYLAESVRLLRVGGIVVFDNALWHNRVADPAQRDPDTVAVRELGKLFRSDERLRPLMIPLGDGILAAVRTFGLALSRLTAGSPGRGRRNANRRTHDPATAHGPRSARGHGVEFTSPCGQPFEQQAHAVPGGALAEDALVGAAAADARDVQVRPRPLAGELAQEQRRGDGARAVGRADLDVGQVGHAGVETRDVVVDQRHPPEPLAAGLAPRRSARRPGRRRWRRAPRPWPRATPIAPVSVAMSIMRSGSSSASA